MRDYQRKKGEYTLPLTVYRVTISVIRNYEHTLQQIDEITETLGGVDYSAERVQTSGISDIVPAAAERMSIYKDRIRSVDNALLRVPVEYRRGVWESIQDRKPYPLDASRSTYGRWKAFFVFHVAKNLNLI